MTQLIKFLLSPLVFGFGFIAPLIAQLLGASGIDSPRGLSILLIGLIVGGAWGAVAQWRGSWLWVKP